MSRRISLALLLAFPGSLIGHVLAYALAGHSLTDARHGYLEPALIYSSLVLGLLCAAFVLDALMRAAVRSEPPEQFAVLWGCLSFAQIVLFWAFERLEMTTPGWQAYVVQILVALVAALLLVFFAHVLAHCNRSAWQVQQYLQRMLATPHMGILPVAPASPAFSLSIVAGRSRFSRPPPQA